MPSRRELAKTYADRLRGAAKRSSSSSPGVKTASADFNATVNDVLARLDRLSHEESGELLSPDELASFCELVDDELGVEPGTIYMLKEGSVQNLIAYQNMALKLRSRLILG